MKSLLLLVALALPGFGFASAAAQRACPDGCHCPCPDCPDCPCCAK